MPKVRATIDIGPQNFPVGVTPARIGSCTTTSLFFGLDLRRISIDSASADTQPQLVAANLFDRQVMHLGRIRNEFAITRPVDREVGQGAGPWIDNYVSTLAIA